MQLSEELARAFASMGRLLNDAQGEDLSRSDFAVLIRLPLARGEGEAVRSRDLARSEGLDPSTMSRRLASLADRGLIEREPDPADRRAFLLTLTAAGRRAVEQERARRVALVTDALQRWDDADRAELARLLSRLTDTLEDRRSAR
ncbi:MarR family winged helix-turn-helix transcriptional regulator [Ornithinimicrobium cerasi]|uniref:Transcriptional regulator, MarR family n=1 Tax=Ornithinimicrobium cerasi TaxID=2248773 RepID=A0A285VVG9_9MICO|nr:MarR family transcriptional regulator [Ornithinimicrobium cerasi]SOC57963.1 transcriptional regulator, MarR family [Ornithinimicrobium cerasi]